MTRNSDLITLVDVTKQFQMGTYAVTAVRNVNLTLKRGDFLVIVGSSGSGKSTLLHLIGGLVRPSSGQIRINDRDLNNLSDKELATHRRKFIGLVFQSFNLLAGLSAIDNTALPMIFDEVPEAERHTRACNALRIVGLSNRQNHRPNELSGGQQQRVAIARALIMNPSVILADEPTGNLDTQTGNEILDLLKSLSDDGRTVMLVTHDHRATRYAKNIVRMSDGMIVDTSSARNLTHQ
jgi:putative ABC transport system ATP-binding protein